MAIFCICGLPIIAYIVSKMLAHNERMELIRMGYYSGGYPSAGMPPAVPNPAPGRSQPSSAKIVVLPPLRLEASRREN